MSSLYYYNETMSALHKRVKDLQIIFYGIIKNLSRALTKHTYN